jgi:hypothetical protein
VIGLTLRDIERELMELADEAGDDDGWSYGAGEKLRALARRIAVQIVNDAAA